MSERYTFKIPIGDWSGDGHGKCDYVIATATKPIEAVREAYFAARKKLPKCCPEKFCDDYEDGSVPADTRAALRKAGAPLGSDDDLDNGDGFGVEEMASIVAWFINQGDPSLGVEIAPVDAVPSLAFYGYDAEKRHIDFIGYGLQGS